MSTPQSDSMSLQQVINEIARIHRHYRNLTCLRIEPTPQDESGYSRSDRDEAKLQAALRSREH